jgi:hypothetical protein
VRWRTVSEGNGSASTSTAFREPSSGSQVQTASSTARASQDIAKERSARGVSTSAAQSSGEQSSSGPELRSVVWSSRSGHGVPVKQAQFELPDGRPLQVPPGTGFKSESVEVPKATEDKSSTDQRSLLVPEDKAAIPRTPFPPSDMPDAAESPSDNPQDALREGRRLPQTPAQRQGRLEDCESIRNELTKVEIQKINLDISPAFGVGPKSSESPTERRKSFVEKAPIRAWNDYRGNFIIDGRLVDMRYDAIEIELADGTRDAIYLRDLSDADRVYVSEAWWLPVTCGISSETPAERTHVASTVTWRASNLCHKPLYFEDTQLERYGHEFGPVSQPLISTAHFFGNVVFLPYKMGIHPLSECQYALGYYRPGNCAPWTIAPVPLSLRGAAVQGAAITGAAVILP